MFVALNSFNAEFGGDFDHPFGQVTLIFHFGQTESVELVTHRKDLCILYCIMYLQTVYPIGSHHSGKRRSPIFGMLR